MLTLTTLQTADSMTACVTENETSRNASPIYGMAAVVVNDLLCFVVNNTEKLQEIS